MFDLIAPRLEAASTPVAIAAATPAHTSVPPHWFALMLDEIDYGMLLLGDERTVLHANHVARAELDHAHPLQLLGRELRVRRPQDVGPLGEALAAARARGMRRLVRLGADEQAVQVAVVPLPASPGGSEALTLLVFGKRKVCEALTAHWFAREHGLTPAEARVLGALCEGQPPAQIASQQGVALSTVRSQIGAIRAKTGAASIRALARQVAVLPPLVGALRATTVVH